MKAQCVEFQSITLCLLGCLLLGLLLPANEKGHIYQKICPLVCR